MIRGLLLLSVFSVAVSINAQPYIYHYKSPKVTKESEAVRKTIKEWSVKESVTLPEGIDNSTLKFFPEVFSQGANNACSQASGVRYAYTHQVNKMLDRDAKASAENTFAYHFTWNYLNEGNNEGSHAYLGYDLMKQCGAMTLADMNDNSAAVSATTWITGYDKYIKAMKYGVEKYEKINLKTREGIDKMRQYLYTGGVATFSCYSSGWGDKNYNGASSKGIKYIVTRSSSEGAHALTMVGYDDKVEYDFNGNGQLEDNERGAFIFVNSWGTYWGDEGMSYFPYSLFTTPVEQGGVREVDAEAYIVTPKIEEPKIYAKFKITYNRRNELFFRIGANENSEATSANPDLLMQSSIMNLQGGAYNMQGELTTQASKTIEVALNYSSFYDKIKGFSAPRFFLIVRRIAASGTGSIDEFSIVDAVAGKEYKATNLPIALSGGEIIISTNATKVDGVSRNSTEWLIQGTKTPYTSPFILRRANGKQVKFKISGYDSRNGKMTIKYKKY